MQTISEEYRKAQQELHKDDSYGSASIQFAPIVSKMINKTGVTELLDIGAGKMRLFENLVVDHKMKLQAYDPAIPEISDDPVPMQMTTCIDVLEHVEPELLDNFLDFLKQKTLEIGFFTIHTHPAKKILPDGRNAHLTQQPPEWWLPKLMERFDLQMFQRLEKGFMVAVSKKE